jgi:MFS family permease
LAAGRQFNDQEPPPPAVQPETGPAPGMNGTQPAGPQPDREPHPPDRRSGPPDRRLGPADRRSGSADRRPGPSDQRSGPADQHPAPADRRPDQPAAPEPAARAATYRDVFAVRAYRHLFSAYVLSQFGDQLTKVALAVLVFDRTKSAALAAVAYAVAFVPWVIGGPLLSSYADLLPRRQVMVACDVARCGLVGILAIPGMPIPALIAVLFVANLLAPPFASSRAAMMPDLLDGDRYMVANGVDQLVRQSSQVIGFLLGGVTVTLLHAQGALLADAATFAVSALVLLRGVPDLPPATSHSRRFSLLRDTGGGVRIVFGDPVLRAYVVLFWVASAFTYAYEGIAAPWAMQLHGGAGVVGMILAAGPLGITVGAFLLTRVLAPAVRMRLLIPFALLSVLALVPALMVRTLPGVLLLLFLAGLGSAFNAPLNALFVRAVPAEYRGRAFGVAMSGVQAIQGVAMLAAGLVAGVLGAGRTVGWCGIIGTVAVTIIAWKLWPRNDFHRGRQPLPTPAS